MINGATTTSTACQKTVVVGVQPFIDLNIKKVFADTLNNAHAMFNSGDTISFKLIVGNSGNTTATNFTVKDYLPASLQYISSTPNGTATPNGNGTTIVWTIPSLAAGATTEITIQAKIIVAKGDRNLTEICDYDKQ